MEKLKERLTELGYRFEDRGDSLIVGRPFEHPVGALRAVLMAIKSLDASDQSYAFVAWPLKEDEAYGLDKLGRHDGMRVHEHADTLLCATDDGFLICHEPGTADDLLCSLRGTFRLESLQRFLDVVMFDMAITVKEKKDDGRSAEEDSEKN